MQHFAIGLKLMEAALDFRFFLVLLLLFSHVKQPYQ
jgi:hypothetical protein